MVARACGVAGCMCSRGMSELRASAHCHAVAAFGDIEFGKKVVRMIPFLHELRMNKIVVFFMVFVF